MTGDAGIITEGGWVAVIGGCGSMELVVSEDRLWDHDGDDGM